MNTRREFVQWMAASGVYGSGGLLGADLNITHHMDAVGQQTSPDIGSLLPFIQGQAVKGEFPSSFLSQKSSDAVKWRSKMRKQFLEMLQYSPPKCPPNAEEVEKVDRGSYIREKVHFNTTPDIRVPAYVLIPKGLNKPAPGIVALHDHGGFYMWGKEKLVELDDEHATLTDFKKNYYSGRSTACELARQGYVVIVIDMFYWGERRMLLDNDPADWRDRPRTMPATRVNEFNQRSSRGEELVAR